LDPILIPERRRIVRSDCRQEECEEEEDISQASDLSISSDHRMDQGEPARSLKCKEKQAHKISKEGGPSIFR
jgi:hypothetical protein